MKRISIFFSIVAIFFTTNAAWYWPFGSDDEPERQRLSELMEPATDLIDKASDYAEDGKVDEAVASYRMALGELDRIELENPERAATAEFATLRNKRAYVNAAIDSLLLKQARKNAKSVAITDTTELEKKYRRLKDEREEMKNPAKRQSRIEDEEDADLVAKGLVEKKEKVVEEEVVAVDEKRAGTEEKIESDGKEPATEIANQAGAKPRPKRVLTRRDKINLAVADLNKNDFAGARLTVSELLAEKPNDEAALNLRGMIEMAEGDLGAAEETFYTCTQSNPRRPTAYYNLAKIVLKRRGADGRTAAKRYYDMSVDFGGAADSELEEALK